MRLRALGPGAQEGYVLGRREMRAMFQKPNFVGPIAAWAVTFQNKWKGATRIGSLLYGSVPTGL
jgi:hypothetical protein